MKTKYTVDYFIAKFRGIPAKRWSTHVYCTDDERHCALGHCGVRSGTYPPEAAALNNLFDKHRMFTVDVNDGYSRHYHQPTPRARILAALRDIKKATA